jgi:hypothetical protein
MPKGGFSIVSFGQSSFAGARSAVEPRFLVSRPRDRSTQASQDVTLRYEIYNFDGWIELEDIVAEISEDGGATFSPAYDHASGFIAPYDGVNSKIRRNGGHSVVVYVHKTVPWPKGKTITIRTVAPDGFNQSVSKEVPMTWG